MRRRVFYSFHFDKDAWRAGQVRNIGAMEGNEPVSDNDWEAVKRGGDQAIKKWIEDQLDGRSCTIVLVGSETAGRRWVTYEISRSWNKGKGVVGIRIHGLEDHAGRTSAKGGNPFDSVTFKPTGQPLSQIVKCYDPQGRTGKERYDWISRHLDNAVEEAIRIRNRY